MDSSVSPKDEIWFLRVCHHISSAVYVLLTTLLLTRTFKPKTHTPYCVYIKRNLPKLLQLHLSCNFRTAKGTVTIPWVTTQHTWRSTFLLQWSWTLQSAGLQFLVRSSSGWITHHNTCLSFQPDRETFFLHRLPKMVLTRYITRDLAFVTTSE
jgi:hypothetical protein